jgi:hypothetical protein
MSENDHGPDMVDESAPLADVTGELGWDTLEHEQPSASEAGAGAGARTVIELPDKQRPSLRCRARRSSEAPIQRAGRDGGPSWLAAGAAAVLAACAGAAIALAIAGSPAHLYKPTPTSATPRSAGRRPHTKPEHHRRTRQRVKTPRAHMPTGDRGDSGSVTFARAPAGSPAASAAPPPAPAPPVDTEGNAQGGPFSP